MKMTTALLLQFVACWPVLIWYTSRLTEQNCYALLPLLGLIYFVFRSKDKSNLSPFQYRFVLIVTPIYATAACMSFPPILLALLVSLNIAVLISPIFNFRWYWPALSLLLLSLPIMASVQFFAGYPLRVIVANGTSFLLNCSGINVTALGATLEWQGQQIAVDAPCSGLNMLWTGLFLSSLLCCLSKFSSQKFFVASCLSVLLIIVGNIFRATSLFYLENSSIDLPAFAHGGIGVLVFVLTCGFIYFTIEKLERMPWQKSI